ncbi:MAG: phage minor head protein, partial [Bacteroidales bacterium]
TTAAVQDGQIRAGMKAALEENIASGKGQKEFTRMVDGMMDSAGYSRLKPHQIENIYVTNTSLAFAAGQMAQMAEASDEFPYWRYSATMDGHTRPEHAALHGKIFKNGDFTFWPPISFRCRCSAIPMTVRQAGKYGVEAFPDRSGKRELFDTIPNKAFAGDKQRNYMNWLAKEYKDTDKHTRALIDQTLTVMKKEVVASEYEAFKDLFTSEAYNNRIYKPYYSKEFAYVRKAGKEAGLSTSATQRAFAFTDFENNIARDMARQNYTEDSSQQYTPSQLKTFQNQLLKDVRKLPLHEGVVYRNLDKVPDGVLKQWTKKGGVTEWDGFSSTTTDPNIYPNREVRLKIFAKTGRNIEEFSMYPNEKEVLILPGTRLQITSVKITEKQTLITMSELK